MTASTGWKSLLVLAIIGLISLPIAATSQNERLTLERVKAALPELEKTIGQSLSRTGAPGLAIAIVFGEETVFLKGFGVREAGKNLPVGPDTVFQLASVSKPIASTVVAAVVGEGLASWDDPIIKHDPAFQMYDPWVTRQITFRDLFSHRSGLPDHAADALEDVGYEREAVLFRLRYQKPAASFRSTYFYTNFGLTEAAVAAAKAAGKSWEDLSDEKLYRPLGMRNTSSRHADYLRATDRAKLHVRVDGKFVHKYDRNPDAQSPAGGVSSTVRDLVSWMRLHLGNGKFNGRQMIAAEALAETHIPHMVSNRPGNPAVDRAGFYGLGWNVSYDERGNVHWNHSGGFALGASTNVSLRPGDGLGIAVLTNVAPIGLAEAIGLSFVDIVQTGKVQRDWVAFLGPIFAGMFKPDYGTEVDYSKPLANRSPALPLDAYLGKYHNDLFGEIEIAAKAGALELRLGPKKMTFPLKHYDRDIYTYQPTGENAYGLSAVAFTVGIEKRATNVAIEILNKNGDGSFKRVAAK